MPRRQQINDRNSMSLRAFAHGKLLEVRRRLSLPPVPPPTLLRRTSCLRHVTAAPPASPALPKATLMSISALSKATLVSISGCSAASQQSPPPSVTNPGRRRRATVSEVHKDAIGDYVAACDRYNKDVRDEDVIAAMEKMKDAEEKLVEKIGGVEGGDTAQVKRGRGVTFSV